EVDPVLSAAQEAGRALRRDQRGGGAAGCPAAAFDRRPADAGDAAADRCRLALRTGSKNDGGACTRLAAMGDRIPGGSRGDSGPQWRDHDVPGLATAGARARCTRNVTCLKTSS